MLIDGEEIERRQNERQKSHAAKGNVGDQKNARQPDRFPAKRGAAAGEVFKKSAAVANPSEVFAGGREFRNDVQRKLGEEIPHAFDEPSVQLVGAGGEGNLDFWFQCKSSPG